MLPKVKRFPYSKTFNIYSNTIKFQMYVYAHHYMQEHRFTLCFFCGLQKACTKKNLLYEYIIWKSKVQSQILLSDTHSVFA